MSDEWIKKIRIMIIWMIIMLKWVIIMLKWVIIMLKWVIIKIYKQKLWWINWNNDWTRDNNYKMIDNND